MKSFKFSFRNLKESHDLTPHDSHKSYYGKAEVYTLKGGIKVLRSYSTYVAVIGRNGQIYRTWLGWSATTGRHIASFCGLNKKQYEQLPLAKVI